MDLLGGGEMKPIGGHHHRHMHAGSICRRTRRVIKRGKRPRREVVGLVHDGVADRSENNYVPDECELGTCPICFGAEDDVGDWFEREHPQPFASAMWLAFLGLPQ